MSKDLNKSEIEWLHEQPQRLLTHYQNIIEANIASFIRKGFFQTEEKSDLVQQINLQMLEGKLEKIKDQFNGTVYLRTYFSKIVYNTCIEITRQKKRQATTTHIDTLYDAATDNINAFEQMAIRDELLRFEAMLRGLGKKQYKAKLCLKLAVRVILEMLDIQFYTGPKTTSEIEKIRANFFQPYDEWTDKEIFELLISLFNKVENKNNDSDSLRKWVYQLIERMVKLMNSGLSPSNYEKESLKILMQLYFSDQANMKK